MKFYTQYDAYQTPPEKAFGEVLVETQGYISAQKRIENMMMAGQRLVDYRKAKYDFPEGKEPDETYYDPTREKSFDLADATKMQFATEARLKASEALAKPYKEEVKDGSNTQVPSSGNTAGIDPNDSRVANQKSVGN